VHILITNDDGVQAPGLLALAQELRKLGKVTVLAPDRNWSMSGHVKTIHTPMKVVKTLLRDGSPAYAASGAPSDCVALAMLGLLEEPVDLVVSGINPYANLGHDITYSGTVTAAMEATIAGITGIAVSLDGPLISPEEVDFGPAARAAKHVIETVIKQKLPENILLSVNVPYLPDHKINGYQITRQGTRIYRDLLIRKLDEKGEPVYIIGGEFPTGLPEEGTDIGALNQGIVSITPISMDMTAYQHIDQIGTWNWGGSNHHHAVAG